MSRATDIAVVERAARLRGFGIWSALSDSVLQATAAAMQPMGCASGEFIIRHGEPGRHLHVLMRGEADVRVHTANGTIVNVGKMTPGACFGEMSLLSGDLTSADVVAATDCETLALDRPAFEALVASQPQLLRQFVGMVSRRLFDSNVAMGAAREKEKGLTRFLQEVQTGQERELIGKLPSVRALQQQVEAQADCDTPLLIQGERGTGKELVARLIHFRGRRREAPLLCTDCGQISETPWGDKLFGAYRSGPAELGASHVTYLDLAAGGTMVLKNLDALPRAIQDRLAEHISREARQPSGAAGVRIIATCRASFNDLSSAGRVSPALAGVLNRDALVIPPLRERKRDIPALAAYFVQQHARRLGKPAPTLDDQAITKLVTHDYLHANVNELEEAIRRAVVLTDGPAIESEAVFLGQPSLPSRWTFDLLSAGGLGDWRAALRLLLRAARGLVAAMVVFVLYAALFGTARWSHWATILVWSVGWPLLAASCFVGRAACALCPFPSVARAVQRVYSARLKVPAWLKRHDTTIVIAGFSAIIWAEEVTRMRGSPRATAMLLLAILSGAVVTAVLMPRRTWCRHLCPMGGFLGAGGMTGLVELRPTSDICAAKCLDHSCYKGDGRAEGCPLFHHLMFLDSNQHCVLCLQCVEVCPNDSPRLNVRLPARDLVTAADPSPVARWTVTLGGLLVVVLLLHQWERQAAGIAATMLRERRLLVVTAALALGALVPQALLQLVASRRRASAGAGASAGVRAVLSQQVAAWMPVVVAGFLAYQLARVETFESLRLTVGAYLPDGRTTAAHSAAVRSIVQVVILAIGLAMTAGVLWNQRQPAGEEPRSWWRRNAVGLGSGAAYWTLLLWLLG